MGKSFVTNQPAELGAKLAAADLGTRRQAAQRAGGGGCGGGGSDFSCGLAGRAAGNPALLLPYTLSCIIACLLRLGGGKALRLSQPLSLPLSLSLSLPLLLPLSL